MIPGMGKIDPRKLQGMMKQLGINQSEIEATRVVIEQGDKRIVIENPNDKKIGLYIKNDIIKEISNVSNDWKQKNEIDIIKNDKILKNTLTGNFLQKENIKKYSTKYYKMLEIIEDIILNNSLL